jgi:hypothetical protein
MTGMLPGRVQAVPVPKLASFQGKFPRNAGPGHPRLFRLWAMSRSGGRVAFSPLGASWWAVAENRTRRRWPPPLRPRYPWTQIGISERRYYKLLPLFAQKINGRYDVDFDDVVARMKAYLDSRDSDRGLRAAALDLLRERGFSEQAAHKWLQRHRPEEALEAWPRGRRP